MLYVCALSMHQICSMYYSQRLLNIKGKRMTLRQIGAFSNTQVIRFSIRYDYTQGVIIPDYLSHTTITKA